MCSFKFYIIDIQRNPKTCKQIFRTGLILTFFGIIVFTPANTCDNQSIFSRQDILIAFGNPAHIKNLIYPKFQQWWQPKPNNRKMKNYSFIIHNSLSFPKCMNMEIGIIFVQITESNILHIFIALQQSNICCRMFEIRVRKKYQCFFQRNLDFRKYSEFLFLSQDLACYEIENIILKKINTEYYLFRYQKNSVENQKK